MNSKERAWLQEKLNSGSGELSDDDLLVFLRDPSATDADLLHGINFVKTWLSRKALVPLFELVLSDTRPERVRKAAAEAISEICDEVSKQFLSDAFKK